MSKYLPLFANVIRSLSILESSSVISDEYDNAHLIITHQQQEVIALTLSSFSVMTGQGKDLVYCGFAVGSSWAIHADTVKNLIARLQKIRTMILRAFSSQEIVSSLVIAWIDGKSGLDKWLVYGAFWYLMDSRKITLSALCALSEEQGLSADVVRMRRRDFILMS